MKKIMIKIWQSYIKHYEAIARCYMSDAFLNNKTNEDKMKKTNKVDSKL